MFEDLSAIAYHEAGHAVAAVILKGEVVRVTLEPESEDGQPERDGDVEIRWHHRGLSKRDLLEREITVCLAGPAAEMLYSGERPHPSKVQQWRADWAIAWELAGQLISAPERRLKMLEGLLGSLCKMFDEQRCWQAIAETADELEAHETLEGEQVAEIVQRWLG